MNANSLWKKWLKTGCDFAGWLVHQLFITFITLAAYAHFTNSAKYSDAPHWLILTSLLVSIAIICTLRAIFEVDKTFLEE